MCSSDLLVWLRRSIGHAFIRWRNNARDLIIQRRKVQVCLARMSRRRCFSAFNTWHANARELGIQRRKVQTIVARMSQRRVLLAFNSWVSVAADLQRQRKVISYVLAKFMGRAKEAAFYDWLCVVEDRKHAETQADESLKVNLELSRRVALTWTKRNISFAFIRWKNNARAYKMQRRRLESALEIGRAHV